MRQRPSPDPKRDRAIRDRLVNECLDSIAEGDAGLARAMIRASSEVAPGADRDVAELRRLLRPLTRLPASPDLSSRILAETHRRRPFLSGVVRHRISAWRVSLAASFLLLITGGYLLTETVEPSVGPVMQTPAPLASVAPAEPMSFSLFDAPDEAPRLVAAAPSPRRQPLSLSGFADREPARRWDVSPIMTDSIVTASVRFREAAPAVVARGRPSSLPAGPLLWSGGRNASINKAEPMPTWWLAGSLPSGRWPHYSAFTMPIESEAAPHAPEDLLSLPRIDLRQLLSRPN